MHPPRLIMALTAALALLAAPLAAETAADRLDLHRGVNFEIWVEWLSVEDMVTAPDFLTPYPDWRRHMMPGEINALKTAGFDFVRLPFDPAPLLRIGPGARQDALIRDIAATTHEVQTAGLKTVVDLHSFPREGEAWGVDTILSDPALFGAYVLLEGKVAAALNGMDPDRTAFEVMNEPTIDCEPIFSPGLPQLWPEMLARLHTAARAQAPDLPIVLSGACWGGAEGLETLDPAAIADDNTIWSFHSYTPFLFSHQAASWTGGLETVMRHLPYPPDLLDDQTIARLTHDAEARGKAAEKPTDPPATAQNLREALEIYRAAPKDTISIDAAKAAAWADRHGIGRNRLLLGEFGALHAADNGDLADHQSRHRFVSAKRQSTEDLGIAWAVWTLSGDFGISTDIHGFTLDPAACADLGVGPCP